MIKKACINKRGWDEELLFLNVCCKCMLQDTPSIKQYYAARNPQYQTILCCKKPPASNNIMLQETPSIKQYYAARNPQHQTILCCKKPPASNNIMLQETPSIKQYYAARNPQHQTILCCKKPPASNNIMLHKSKQERNGTSMNIRSTYLTIYK